MSPSFCHTITGILAQVFIQAPPQLWKLETVRSKPFDTASNTVRLSLRHTYMPKFTVDFAGPSYFGGKDDQLVLCASKGEFFRCQHVMLFIYSQCEAGDIHIWDRESGALLHHIRAQALGGDLTCIAWNPAAEPFMFATGSHDGGVRIWTSPPEPPGAPTVVAFNPGPTSTSMTPQSGRSSLLHVDVDYRTDSPLAEEEGFDLGDNPGRSNGDSGSRTLAFTPPRALGDLFSR